MMNSRTNPTPAAEAKNPLFQEMESAPDLKVPDLDEIDLEKMKRVYICAPYLADSREERRRNTKYVKSLAWFACTRGMVPVAPRLMYSAFLDDEDIDEHCYGVFCSFELLRSCSEVWVPEDLELDKGMKMELRQAKTLGLPVRFFHTV